jgi:hypothetical protein
VKFSHHAKNNLRLYGVRAQEVESVVKNSIGKDFERRGNPRYRGTIRRRPYLVVVALDEPSLIITHFPEERG